MDMGFLALLTTTNGSMPPIDRNIIILSCVVIAAHNAIK